MLAYHWPDARLYCDITKVNPRQLPPVDVITFGFPCQDLSIAGARAGLAGNRSGLFYHATRILRTVQPRFAIAENVPGLFTSDEGRDFAAVLGELAELGPDVAWATLDSQFFGVPQRRDRVFVVVDFVGERAAEVLALDQSLRGSFREGDSPGEETAGTIGASLGGSDVRHAQAGQFISAPLGSKAGDGGPRTTDLDHGAFILEPEMFNAEGSTGATLTKSNVGKQLNNQTPLIAFSSKDDFQGLAEDQSPSLQRSHSSMAIAHQTCIRRLMPVECERLMGWPDEHTLRRMLVVREGNTWQPRYPRAYEMQADSPRYRQIGNGVVAPVSRWLAEQTKKALT